MVPVEGAEVYRKLHSAVWALDITATIALTTELLASRKADRSGVWHPTGFVVVQLWTEGGRCLRLHVWPATSRRLSEPCWPIHDHVWSLRSVILVGSLHTDVYQVLPGRDHPLFEVQYADGVKSKLVRQPRGVTLGSNGGQTCTSKCGYALPSRVFHSSAAERESLTATIVATWRDEHGWPYVVGSGDAVTVEVERRIVSNLETQDLIDAVLDALKQ